LRRRETNVGFVVSGAYKRDEVKVFDPTLNGVMAQVEAGRIVLPAMQRPFVWKDDRIAKLIDSLLRGFPIGTALLWKTATMQRFRRFQKDVDPNAGITVDFDSNISSERYLVLDGQQRLTSLYAAITGTYDGKKLFLDVLRMRYKITASFPGFRGLMV